MDGPWLSVWFMLWSNVNTDPFQLLIRLKQGTLAQFANLGEICVTFREWRRRTFVKEHCQVLAFDKNLWLTRLKFLIIKVDIWKLLKAMTILLLRNPGRNQDDSNAKGMAAWRAVYGTLGGGSGFSWPQRFELILDIRSATVPLFLISCKTGRATTSSSSLSTPARRWWGRRRWLNHSLRSKRAS